MALYGGGAAEDEAPMDDMDMGLSDTEVPPAYEPKDDEERAYMEAFPDLDEARMAALKEGVRLCVEKNTKGEYDGGGEDKPPPSDKGGLALIFGEPKKKG